MSKVVMPRIAMLTLYVPAAMARNKPFLLASTYRRETGTRINPQSIRVEPCDSGVWLAVRHYRVPVDACKADPAQYGATAPELPAAPIPADVRQAMTRRWRQAALGLRA